MYTHETQLMLRDTDAAGVAYFGADYAIAHEVYERALSIKGVGLGIWLKSVHLPIVRSEAEYKAPIFLGDQLTLRLGWVRIGQTSFTLKVHFGVHREGLLQSAGWVQTVHVAVFEGATTALPDALRVALREIGAYDEGIDLT